VELLLLQIADSKKPPEVIEKIINGRMRKFYSEVCLTEQEHMVDEGNPKVSKALKDHGLSINSFEMFSI
jgi:elongation factor Ts